MTGESYSTSILVDESPEEVFNAVVNTRGWWAADGIVGETKAQGDEFVFEVPGIHRSEIELKEVIPNKKVVWLAKENWISFVEDKTEWNGTELHFDISEKDGKTELQFTHVGLVPEFQCYEACSGGWTFYIRESLKDLITTGKGQPAEFPDEVALKEQNAENAQ